MATKSISTSIKIKNQKQARNLLYALEHSESLKNTPCASQARTKDFTKEEISKFLIK